MTSPGTFICAVCSKNLASFSQLQRQTHVNHCIDRQSVELESEADDDFEQFRYQGKKAGSKPAAKVKRLRTATLLISCVSQKTQLRLQKKLTAKDKQHPCSPLEVPLAPSLRAWVDPLRLHTKRRKVKNQGEPPAVSCPPIFEVLWPRLLFSVGVPPQLECSTLPSDLSISIYSNRQTRPAAVARRPMHTPSVLGADGAPVMWRLTGYNSNADIRDDWSLISRKYTPGMG